MHWQGGIGVGVLVTLVVLALDWRWWPALVVTALYALGMDLWRGRQIDHYRPPDAAERALLRELVQQQHGCGRSWRVPHEQEAIAQLTRRGHAVIFDNELCATDLGRRFWKDNARPDAQKDRQV